MRIILFTTIILLSLNAVGQVKEKELGLKTINKQVIQAQLEFLASDWMEGREAGTKGNKLAGDYLSTLFKLFGLAPGGEELIFEPNRYQQLLGAQKDRSNSYFQPFSAIEILPSNDQSVSLVKGNMEEKFLYKTDFDVSFLSRGIKVSAPVVFIGHGFENKNLGYSDFDNIDIKDKIVVRLSGLPGDLDPESKAAKEISAKKIKLSATEKNKQAFSRGAIAVLEYDLTNTTRDSWKSNISLRYNGAMFEGDEKPLSFYDKKLRLPSDDVLPPVISISKQMLEAILSVEKIDLNTLLRESLELKAVSRQLECEIALDLNAQTKTVGLRNIIGVIEGENPDHIMVVGAHYDHLGKYNGLVFNGADDNGSGVVAVTTIAKAFMESGVKPKCTIIFALWDGEERGLLGSRRFLETYPDIDKTLLYLNFDMVGRNSSPDAPGNRVAMIYTKAYKNLVEISKKNTERYHLNLDVNFSGVEKPIGGSDNSGFAKKDIPIFWFHTGGHTDYHKASDHVELINWQKLEDIIKISYLNMWEFANNPEAFIK